MHQLPAKMRRSFFDITATDRVVGGRVYDGHIAAVARSTGARIVVTDNRRHFTSLLRHDIRVLSTSEFRAEL